MPSDIQPQLLRRMTVRRILETLQNEGPSSRAELTRLSGISAPTVSKAVTALLELGLLEEGDAPGATLGRPGRLLRLATERSQVIGIVLDAGCCEVVTAGLDGVLDESSLASFETPETYTELIARLTELVQPRVASSKVQTLGVGISMPGMINSRTQQALFSPNMHITDGEHPGADLERSVGVECVLLHETHALCLSERMIGGATLLDDFAMLDFTTGLGLGVFSSGQWLGGYSGLAGELGHITMVPEGRLCGCGNRGCLETLATDTAFVTRVSESLGRRVTLDELLTNGVPADATSQSALDETLDYLAISMAAAINLFNPQVLYVHGRLFDLQEELFEQAVERATHRCLRPARDDCQIVPARGTKVHGAVAGFIQHLTDAVGPTVG